MNREWIGIEKKAAYVKLARKRLKAQSTAPTTDIAA